MNNSRSSDFQTIAREALIKVVNHGILEKMFMKKMEMKEKELELRKMELEFQKEKLKTEEEEWKHQFQLELEERWTTVELLKKTANMIIDYKKYFLP